MMRSSVLVVAMLTLILSACNVTGVQHRYYYQPPQQINLYQNKEEFRLSGNYTLADDVHGFSITSGFSFTNWLGVNVSYQRYIAGDLSGNINGVTTNSYLGHYKEFSVNYFKKFRDHFVLEVYGGIGNGKQEHFYSGVKQDSIPVWVLPPIYTVIDVPYTLGSSVVSNYTYHLQPVIGFVSENYEVAFSLRFNNMNFYKVENDIKYDMSYDHREQFENTVNRRDYVMIEPCLTLRYGFEQYKIQVQLIATGINKAMPQTTYAMHAGILISTKNKWSSPKKDQQFQ